MAKRRREGIFGLVGTLTDEAKWFADQRMPYPIERNVRAAAGSLVNDEPVAATFESSARGVGRAVLDDETDEALAERQAELADLRARIESLAAAVDRLSGD
jgi:hypothetical protein